jgi:hypothetical protein
VRHANKLLGDDNQCDHRRRKELLEKQQALYYLVCPFGPGPKGQDNSAQGLPWVSQKNVFSPEGAPGAGMPQLRSEDKPRRTVRPLQHLQPGGPGVFPEGATV